MAKTIIEEIVDYLKEHDMYYVEEFDEEGFPIDDKANDLIGDMTNSELCDILVESMEDIAEIQSKKDIEKACKVLTELLPVNGEIWSIEAFIKSFKRAMEDKQ